jgi:hypothetical protein
VAEPVEQDKPEEVEEAQERSANTPLFLEREEDSEQVRSDKSEDREREEHPVEEEGDICKTEPHSLADRGRKITRR